MIKINSVMVGSLAVNCYIVTDEATGRTAVIDPGDFSERLDKALGGVGYENIDYILLTHGHFDHIGGVKDVKDKTGGKAKVCIYEGEKDMPGDDYLNLSLMFLGRPLEDKAEIDVLLRDGNEIKLGESTLRVMHTPGHTLGSVCYICDRDIFSGDTLFCGSAGRTDFPTGSLNMLRASLEKLAALDGDYAVHPGHNDETTLSHERAYNPYVRL